MKRTQMKRRYVDTGPDFDTVMLVLARHGYRCTRCDMPIAGERGRDWSLQHRRPRAMGGSRAEDTNAPQNLIPLDGSGSTGCHGHVESHRAEALTFGWLLPQGADPLQHAVLIEHGSRFVYLDAEGGFADNPPEAVAS